MIPNSTIDVEELQGGLPGEQIDLSFDEDSVAHLMSILTDMYEDTIMAPIREYSTNALDEHKASGQTRPIEVTAPTRFDPFFKVRDFGRGLSVEDIRKVYSKYGASTKRDSNDYNGTLGIGAKSGLTYTPSYTISSIKDGMRHEVDVRRSDAGGGYMKVVISVPTSDPSGVEIKIPVNTGDVETFRENIAEFFSWWDASEFKIHGDVKVKSKRDLLKPQGGKSDKIFLYKNSTTYEDDIIVMGNVAYHSPYDNILSNYMPVVYFADIGEAVFTRSREGLMTVDTNRKLLDSIKEQIVSEFRETADKQLAECEDIVDAFALYSGDLRNMSRVLFGYSRNNSGVLAKYANYKGENLEKWFTDKVGRFYNHSFCRYVNGDIQGTYNPRSDEVDQRFNLLKKPDMFITDMPESARLPTSKSHEVAERGLKQLGYDDRVVVGFYENELPDFIHDNKPKVPVIAWESIVEGSKQYLAANRTAKPKVKGVPRPKDEFDILDHHSHSGTYHSGFLTSRGKIATDGDKCVYVSRKVIGGPNSPMSGNHIGTRVSNAVKLANFYGYQIVLIPDNRQDKFKKEYPKAISLDGLIDLLVADIVRVSRASAKAATLSYDPNVSDDKVNLYAAHTTTSCLGMTYSNTSSRQRWVTALDNKAHDIIDPQIKSALEEATNLSLVSAAVTKSLNDSDKTVVMGSSKQRTSWVNLSQTVSRFRYGSSGAIEEVTGGVVKYGSASLNVYDSAERLSRYMKDNYPLITASSYSYGRRNDWVEYINAMYKCRNNP